MSNNTLIDKTAFDKAVSDYSDYHDKWAIAREDLEQKIQTRQFLYIRHLNVNKPEH
jgi:hypothetical protein